MCTTHTAKRTSIPAGGTTQSARKLELHCNHYAYSLSLEFSHSFNVTKPWGLFAVAVFTAEMSSHVYSQGKIFFTFFLCDLPQTNLYTRRSFNDSVAIHAPFGDLLTLLIKPNTFSPNHQTPLLHLFHRHLNRSSELCSHFWISYFDQFHKHK